MGKTDKLTGWGLFPPSKNIEDRRGKHTYSEIFKNYYGIGMAKKPGKDGYMLDRIKKAPPSFSKEDRITEAKSNTGLKADKGLSKPLTATPGAYKELADSVSRRILLGLKKKVP